MKTKDNMEHFFKSNNVDNWLNAVLTGAKETHQSGLLNVVLPYDCITGVSSGILMKKSHNKLIVKFQVSSYNCNSSSHSSCFIV